MNIPMTVLLPSALDIYITGAKSHDSEIRLSRWMIQNLSPGRIVFDIGGHFGFYSLLASSLQCQVVGIEASPSTFSLFQKNVAPYKNIKPFNIAASKTEGEITFYEFPILYSEYNTINPDQFKNAKWLSNNPPKKIVIPGIPIDKIANENNAIPDFIKIDVEGAEAEVISGMTEIIKRHKPIIAMEYLISARINDSHKLATKMLFSEGYLPHAIGSDGTPIKIDDIEESMINRGLDSDNLLFIAG